jgi:4-carboxymuconolactone decarboxylase
VSDSDDLSTDAARREAGTRTRREVLGDDWVDRAAAGTTPFTADFQDFLTRVAWGDVWQRPGLARRERSIATLSVLVALRHWDEFALHVRAAVRNGLTEAEVAEVLQHAAVYAGVPAANHAFRVAGPVLEELRGD